jgi:hypothetical protein
VGRGSQSEQLSVAQDRPGRSVEPVTVANRQLSGLTAPTVWSEIVGFDAERWQAEMMIKRGWVPPEAERPAAHS